MGFNWREFVGHYSLNIVFGGIDCLIQAFTPGLTLFDFSLGSFQILMASPRRYLIILPSTINSALTASLVLLRTDF